MPYLAGNPNAAVWSVFNNPSYNTRNSWGWSAGMEGGPFGYGTLPPGDLQASGDPRFQAPSNFFSRFGGDPINIPNQPGSKAYAAEQEALRFARGGLYSTPLGVAARPSNNATLDAYRNAYSDLVSSYRGLADYQIGEQERRSGQDFDKATRYLVQHGLLDSTKGPGQLQPSIADARDRAIAGINADYNRSAAQLNAQLQSGLLDYDRYLMGLAENQRQFDQQLQLQRDRFQFERDEAGRLRVSYGGGGGGSGGGGGGSRLPGPLRFGDLGGAREGLGGGTVFPEYGGRNYGGFSYPGYYDFGPFGAGGIDGFDFGAAGGFGGFDNGGGGGAHDAIGALGNIGGGFLWNPYDFNDPLF